MNAFKEAVDYEELGKELRGALETDELYRLRNEAKFRAIEQAVPTYENFRQMVNAAQLKALNRKDTTPNVGVKWNRIARQNAVPQSTERRSKTRDPRPSARTPMKMVPTTSHEFRNSWKGLVRHTERFRFLNDSRHTFSSDIFRSEIPPDLLAECLATCLERLKSADSGECIDSGSIIEILAALGRCNRFELAVEFMSRDERAVCEQLFQTLRRMGKANDALLDNLEKRYIS